MSRSKIVLLGCLFWFSSQLLYGQANNKVDVLSKDQLEFLEQLTVAVLEESSIHPGQFISEVFGANNSGGLLIRPGGRNAYPSFWIRDYAMALETDLVSLEAQKHMLLLCSDC